MMTERAALHDFDAGEEQAFAVEEETVFETVDFEPSGSLPTLAEQLATAHGDNAGGNPALAAEAAEPTLAVLAAGRGRGAGLVVKTAALLASVAVHLAATVWFIDGPPTVEIAGGQPVSVSMIGNAFEDTTLAGDTAEQPVAADPVEPVETQPVEETPTEAPVEPESQAAETTTPTTAPVQPETAEAAPTKTAETPDQPTETLPQTADGVVVTGPAEETPEAETEEAEAVRPTMSAEPVEPQAPEAETPDTQAPTETAETLEPLPDPIENVPVPTPRPEYTPPPPPRQVAEPRRDPPPQQRPQGNQGQAQSNQQRGVAEGQAQPGGASQSGGNAQAQQAGNAAVSNYPGQVVTRLRRALRYPSAARRERLTGEVHVSFTISAGGGVGGISISRSSGSPILDQAAVETVQRAAPFPAIPAAAGRSSWPFTVPLAFTR